MNRKKQRAHILKLSLCLPVRQESDTLLCLGVQRTMQYASMNFSEKNRKYMLQSPQDGRLLLAELGLFFKICFKPLYRERIKYGIVLIRKVANQIISPKNSISSQMVVKGNEESLQISFRRRNRSYN